MIKQNFIRIMGVLVLILLLLILLPGHAFGNHWEQLPGTAKDIGIGANGSVWIVGTNPVSGGYGIYRWDGENWEGVDGGAVRIDVDPQGNPWIVNNNGNIYRRFGNHWEQLFGAARDIGIGANGSVWIVGTNPVSGGYVIYRWDGRNWEIGSDDGALQISVDKDGIPWIVNSSNHIYIYGKKRSFSDPWF
jgi:hypothetical protein